MMSDPDQHLKSKIDGLFKIAIRDEIENRSKPKADTAVKPRIRTKKITLPAKKLCHSTQVQTDHKGPFKKIPRTLVNWSQTEKPSPKMENGAQTETVSTESKETQTTNDQSESMSLSSESRSIGSPQKLSKMLLDQEKEGKDMHAKT